MTTTVPPAPDGAFDDAAANPDSPATLDPAWLLRPEQPMDMDQIAELHRTAFAGPWEAELVDAIRTSPHFIPELSFVAATEDGSILGHALISVVGFEPDDDDAPREDVLALAPVAVLPPHAGRGIGSALIRAALAGADTRAEPFVTVLGATPYYARFGFVPAASHDIRGPFEDAGDAFQVRPRPDGPELRRGRVVYPAAFGSF